MSAARRTEARVTDFYANAKEGDAVFGEAQVLLRARKMKLNVLMAYCREPILDALEQLQDSAYSRRGVQRFWRTQSAGCFELELRHLSRGNQRSERDHFVVIEDNHLITVLSFSTARFFARGIEYLLCSYPVGCVQSFMSTDLLHEALHSLADLPEVDRVVVDNAITRVEHEPDLDAEGGTRASRAYETNVRYNMGLSANDFVRTLNSENGWATSVSVTFDLSVQDEFRGIRCIRPVYKLRRNLSACLSLDVDSFSKCVQPMWKRRILDYQKLLENRQRSAQESYKSRPIAIQYSYGLFRKRGSLERLERTVRRYPQASVSVVGREDYFHAAVTDFADGSSFDLWCLSLDKIVIVPQVRSTPRALQRLVAYLCESFHEGDVIEFDVAPCFTEEDQEVDL